MQKAKGNKRMPLLLDMQSQLYLTIDVIANLDMNQPTEEQNLDDNYTESQQHNVNQHTQEGTAKSKGNQIEDKRRT